jgi:hypothetical protein
MATRYPLLAFFGHHKCATKFVLAILKQICTDCGLKLLSISSANQVSDDIQSLVADSRADVFAYMNARWEHVKPLGDCRGFHIVRDPRDVLVSAYFSHLHSHETRNWDSLSAHRKSLRALSKEEGLMLEMDFCEPVFSAMQDWNYDDANILELRFERLVSDPYQSFLNIFEHWELLCEEPGRLSRRLFMIKSMLNRGYQFGSGRLPLRWSSRWIPADRLLTAVYRNRFAKRADGRSPGQENIKHHFRKGVPGDWKNHFSNLHVREFERRYGDLLEKLGYATRKLAAA